jgi:phosphatidylinositol kinase/protein kinase (PI-3  family)
MAVLEAFVYDPLINWRLMQHDTEARRGDQGQSSLPRCVTHCSCLC